MVKFGRIIYHGVTLFLYEIILYLVEYPRYYAIRWSTSSVRINLHSTMLCRLAPVSSGHLISFVVTSF